MADHLILAVGGDQVGEPGGVGVDGADGAGRPGDQGVQALARRDRRAPIRVSASSQSRAARRSPSIIVAQLVDQPGEAVERQQVVPGAAGEQAGRHPEVLAGGPAQDLAGLRQAGRRAATPVRVDRGGRGAGTECKMLTAWSPDVRAADAACQGSHAGSGQLGGLLTRSAPELVIGRPVGSHGPRPGRWRTPTR